jgi:nucleoside-diphosphate-sugar epimerase
MLEKMNVVILGVDGYLGWPLALALINRGYNVLGIDSGLRRRLVIMCGSDSAIPIQAPIYRQGELRRKESANSVPGMLRVQVDTEVSFHALSKALEREKVDCVVHLAHQPSAPYSMIGPAEAAFTVRNNLVCTMDVLSAIHKTSPETPLLTIGTMGEYGTPDVDIPEGWFDFEFRGRKTRALFPRSPGSIYHSTKVGMSSLIEFSCRAWRLRATDIMQGVVYGTRTNEIEQYQSPTRFDMDECFGTAINRFCAQAVLGMPLSVYGKGGQTRGFLPLRDSIQCMIRCIEQPPVAGEYRVVNQFDRCYSVLELAETTRRIARSLTLDVDIAHVGNPRIEAEEHYYKPDREKLVELGYVPHADIDGTIEEILTDLLPHKERMHWLRHAIAPKTQWR